MPVSPAFKPRTDYSRLAPALYHAVKPAEFPEDKLRFWNERWAGRIGLGDLSEAEKRDHFLHFMPFAGAQRELLAMKYHGHQFRHYNPQLGDGRGFLFAQLEDPVDGRLLDFGTKGSGQTPYSRAGDGRLTLKGAVREALATEMLEALGVNTSKTFSFFETGEALHRGDEPSPTRSAVLTRLSYGHIRYGTFQRLAVMGEIELMKELVEYSVRVYFPALQGTSADELHFAMFEKIVANAAELAASWMIAGFVHGVLNTDNMNITGESFDYGPWRFLPVYDPGFTAAYFDHEGLYSYSRQPEAVYWNLDQLARALHVMVPAGKEEVWQDRFVSILEKFPTLFQAELLRKFFERLGVSEATNADDSVSAEEIFVAAFSAMGESKIAYERFFYDWCGGALRDSSPEQSSVEAKYDSAKWREFSLQLENRMTEGRLVRSAGVLDRLASDYYRRGRPETMLIDEVEAIWTAIDTNDDWAPFHAKIAAVRERGRIHGYGI